MTRGRATLRYPRADGLGIPLPEAGMPLPIGKGRILREGTKIALLSLGARLGECLAAAEELERYGLSTTVADARFAKPIDHDLVRRLALNHEVLLTVEEGAIGGFGSFVLHALADDSLLDGSLRVRALTLPDAFQDQDTIERQYAQAGLDARSIVAKVFEVLGRDLTDAARRA